MNVTVKKFNSQPNVQKFSNELAIIFQNLAEEMLYDLTNASKSKLNKTLNGTTPRGERANFRQKGFEFAQVSIIRSNVVKNKQGASIFLNVMVTEGTSNKPHYIWHLINKGFQSGASDKVRHIPIRERNRTKVRNLNTDAFSGYTGDWRTIKAGERPRPVAPREWYATALEEIEKETISKYGMLFEFKRKEANNG